MRRARSMLLPAAAALAVAAALAAVLAGRDAGARAERVRPGAGIDRCDDANPCVDVLTDPESCCPSCGRHIVTRKRSEEMDRRCAKPQPRRRCQTPACGAPRPATPACNEGQCVDLAGG